MTLRSAALLALIATVLVAALRVWNLLFNIWNVTRGLLPAKIVFSSLIYAFAAVSLAIFFFVLHRRQL